MYSDIISLLRDSSTKAKTGVSNVNGTARSNRHIRVENRMTSGGAEGLFAIVVVILNCNRHFN